MMQNSSYRTFKIGLPLLFVMGLLLSSCDTDNTSDFLNGIEKAFQSGENEFALNDLTGFEWDEMCLFYPANSEPYSAYWKYDEYIGRQLPKNALLEKRPYGMIFIFHSEGKYQQFGYTHRYLDIDQKKYWFRLDSEGASSLGGCLKSNIYVRKEEDTHYLVIYKKGV